MTVQFTSIGNACTDLVASVDDRFLIENNIQKSLCTHLKSADELAALKSKIGSFQSMMGGAGANVAHMISALGGTPHFISKIGDTPEGHLFQKDMQDNGVICHFPSPSPLSPESSIVIILITPDGDRTFASYDVVAKTFSYEDYDLERLNQTHYLYLDGHCFCSPHTGKSFIRVAEHIRQQGGHTTFNIGDISHYHDNKSDIDHLLTICDSVICNEIEAETMFGKFPSHALLALHLSERFLFGAITLGANGSIVFYNKHILNIKAVPTLKIVDTNGAGDSFSGGFIYGLMNGYSLEKSGKLGALCAADCISHMGGRPSGGFESLKNLRDLI